MFKYRKFAATAAATLMTVSTLSTGIFAEGSEETRVPQTTASITKTVEVPHGDTKNLTLPNGTQFSFTAEPAGNVEASWDAEPGTEFRGKESSVTIDNAVVQDIEDTKRVIEFADAPINIDVTKFTVPGIYVYTITEDDFNVNGVEKKDTNASYTMKVRIDKVGESMVVQDIRFTDNGVNKIDKPVFVNVYDADPITVSKTITGNQANMDAKFNFTVTINGKAGQTFTMNNKKTVVEADSTPVVFQVELGNGDSVKIDGLTADDTYTVEENGATDYKTSWTVTKSDGAPVTGESKTTGVVTAQNTGTETIAFTNTKEGTVPTGLLFTIAPYALIAGLGGLFAALFFRKKRED